MHYRRGQPGMPLVQHRHTGCSIQAKNNVTSRVRLDEKYVARRALLKVVHQRPQFARVCVVFLQRDARLESSSAEVPVAQKSASPSRIRNQLRIQIKRTKVIFNNDKDKDINNVNQP